MVTATGGDPRPTLLVLNELTPEASAALGEKYAVVPLPRATTLDALPEDLRARVRAVVTNGIVGISAAMMSGLPRLEIICVRGAGRENVDVLAARRLDMVVATGDGANATTVADHALALLLAVVRGVPQADAGVRSGRWREGRDLRPTVSGRRVGILGLGTIGSEIARRCALGFAMSVAYHNRTPKSGSDYAYCGSVLDLAERSDFLIVSAPGGEATHHLVGGAELEALGPDGFLVNVGRGSIVDTQALIEALRHRRVAGAALDVIDGEPEVPAALLALPNVVLTPHIAGRSAQAHAASLRRTIETLDAHFAAASQPVPAATGRSE